MEEATIQSILHGNPMRILESFLERDAKQFSNECLVRNVDRHTYVAESANATKVR